MEQVEPNGYQEHPEEMGEESAVSTFGLHLML